MTDGFILWHIVYQEWPKDDARRWWVMETTVRPNGDMHQRMIAGPFLLEAEAKEALHHA